MRKPHLDLGNSMEVEVDERFVTLLDSTTDGAFAVPHEQWDKAVAFVAAHREGK